MSSFNYDDIEPVQLNQEYPQLCQILYDEEYRSTMGILLALLGKHEYSERALAITEAGISLLGSHYSIWSYRFDIITHLQYDLYKELDWLDSVALDNEKNYQIWNYRQLIINQIDDYDPIREFPILNIMLLEDTKNHHVWTYRRWFTAKFNLFKNPKEVEFVNQLIEKDIYNNSAWSHRYFIKFNDIESTEIDDELNYVMDKIRLSPQNHATWNYLLGIYHKFNIPMTKLIPFLEQFVALNLDSDDMQLQLIKSSIAMELLAKVYNDARSIKIYDLLIEKYDPIREKYWNYLKTTIAI